MATFAMMALLLPTMAVAQVRPVDFDDVEGCKSLGEITGKTGVCSLGRARANAMKEAEKLNATHIVWTNARCVLFAGHRAQGEMFDCRDRQSAAPVPTTPAVPQGEPGPLGLRLSLIPQDLRAKLGRNTGAYVVAVDDESPAFFANVLPGDVIVRAGSTDVRTPRDLADAQVGDELQVLRNGSEVSITPR